MFRIIFDFIGQSEREEQTLLSPDWSDTFVVLVVSNETHPYFCIDVRHFRVPSRYYTFMTQHSPTRFDKCICDITKTIVFTINVDSSKLAKMHTSANFTLRGGDAAFANRQRMLFDQLSIAESSCNKRAISEVDDTEMGECEGRSTARDDRRLKRETKKFRGKESIFKRPEGPAPRANFRNIPDYHRNPHKWTKYSLDDVPSEDMTERSNTQAAMSFLNELKARREKEEADQCEEKMDIEPELDLQESVEFKSKKRTSTSQMRFRKPQKQDVEEDSEAADSKLVFKSSKIILPEYVIGQKPKKPSKKNRPMVKVDRSKELKLDHLQEPDPEEEDNRDI